MPSCKKLAPMDCINFAQLGLNEFNFCGFSCGIKFATHAPETVVDEIGIDYICLAVIPDISRLPGLPCFPDFTAIHPELAGKTE